MMKEKEKVALMIKKERLKQQVELKIYSQDNKNMVGISIVVEEEVYTFFDNDYFSALCKLRNALQDKGFILCCNGGRRNVWPSRMARQMSNGRKAYEMFTGKPATSIIDVFGSCESTDIVSVEEQKNFYSDWLKSLS